MTPRSHDGSGDFEYLPCRRGDMPGRDAVGLEEVVVWRGLAIDVAQADAAQRRWTMLAEHFGHGAAEPADDRVVFGGDDAAGPLREGDNGVGVDRLERRQMEDAGRNSFGREHVGRLQHTDRLHAGADETDVAAVAQEDTWTDLERVVIGEDHRRRVAGDTQVHGTRGL